MSRRHKTHDHHNALDIGETTVNQLRRKIVLSSPLLAVPLFAGCGGGEGNDSDQQVGRATAQAVGAGSNQSLVVTQATSGQGIDAIWTVGGVYLVPSASPSIQAVVNGTGLYISMIEQVVVSATDRITRSMTLALTGQTPATNNTYSVGSATGEVRIVRHKTDGSTPALQTFAYTTDSGSIKITSVNTSTRVYALQFTAVKFQPATTTSSAGKAFLLGGSSSLFAPTETLAWV